MQFGARRLRRFIVRRLEDQGTSQQPAPRPVEGLPPIPTLKRPKGRDPGGSIRMRPAQPRKVQLGNIEQGFLQLSEECSWR
jgi:hypothetical protein